MHNNNAATGVLSCLSAAFTGSAAACQPVAIHILSSLLAAKTSLGDVKSTLYITPEGSSSRELLGSTNVALANVIDAGLGMLLGSETSGTAARLYVVPEYVLQYCQLSAASSRLPPCVLHTSGFEAVPSVLCLLLLAHSQCWSSSSNELHVFAAHRYLVSKPV